MDICGSVIISRWCIGAAVIGSHINTVMECSHRPHLIIVVTDAVA